MDEKPKVSKAQQRATNKWIAKAYDRINLTVPKGNRETIQAHAQAIGESTNAFINRAISETMERDSGAEPPRVAQAAESPLPSETLKAAQNAAQAAGETTADFIGRAVTEQAARDERSRKLASFQGEV